MAYEFGNYRVVARREEPDALTAWGEFEHVIQYRPRGHWEALAAALILTDAITMAKALRDKDRSDEEAAAAIAAEFAEDAE